MGRKERKNSCKVVKTRRKLLEVVKKSDFQQIISCKRVDYSHTFGI